MKNIEWNYSNEKNPRKKKEYRPAGRKETSLALNSMEYQKMYGFGDNTWEYASYVWTMLKHYIGNVAESYLYWIPGPGAVQSLCAQVRCFFSVEEGRICF